MLEKNHRWPLLTEPDLGIHIDLIEPEAYEPPASGAQLLAEDEALIKSTKDQERGGGTGKLMKPNVPWLGRTIYYGNDDMYAYQMGSKPVVELPVPIQEEVKEKTAAELQEEAEQSFAGPRRPLTELQHPAKNGLKAVASWELRPELSRWTSSYMEVVFEEDPTADNEALAKATPAHRAAVARTAVVHVINQIPVQRQQREFEDLLAELDKVERKVAELEEEEREYSRGLSDVDKDKLLDSRNQLAEMRRQIRDLDALREVNFAYYVPEAGQKRRRAALQAAGIEADGSEAATEADDEMEDGEEAATRMMCMREYIENEGRKHHEEWNDDHFVFTLRGSGKEGEAGVAEFNPLSNRTYLKRNKKVFTFHQLEGKTALSKDKIKDLMRNKNRRLPTHHRALLRTRGMTEAEKGERADAVKAIIEGRSEAVEGEGGASKDDAEADKSDAESVSAVAANGAVTGAATKRAVRPSYDSSSSDSEGAAPRAPHAPAAPTRASSSSSDD